MAAKKRDGDILGYARVSTEDQDLAGQRQRLTEAGAVRTFEDIVSGKRFDRPGLIQLLDHARPGDTLCVVRLDRLGRSLKELLETVDDLKRRDVNFMSLEEKIDTASAAGELIFHVFGAIAHFERRLIGERTRDGLAAAKARGSRAGRPPAGPTEDCRWPCPRRKRHVANRCSTALGARTIYALPRTRPSKMTLTRRGPERPDQSLGHMHRDPAFPDQRFDLATDQRPIVGNPFVHSRLPGRSGKVAHARPLIHPMLAFRTSACRGEDWWVPPFALCAS